MLMYYGNFAQYFSYYLIEKQKGEIIKKGAYLIVKGIIRPQEDDKLFNALDELFNVSSENVSCETSEDIKNRILNKVRGS